MLQITAFVILSHVYEVAEGLRPTFDCSTVDVNRTYQPCPCMFCGKSSHTHLHESNMSMYSCPDYNAFMIEKLHFEEIHHRSLESCTQILVGVFVESIRKDWSLQLPVPPPPWRHGKDTNIAGKDEDLDPLDWAGRQAHDMCERLLEEDVAWCQSFENSSEFSTVCTSTWDLWVDESVPCRDYWDWHGLYNLDPSLKAMNDFYTGASPGISQPFWWSHCQSLGSSDYSSCDWY